MNPTTPSPLNRPGLPGQPVPMQGPPGHGQPSSLDAELPGSWVIDQRSVPRMPPEGAVVKAVPYELESGVGRQSNIPYHRVNFKVIEGDYTGYDRLNFLVSESPKAAGIAERFFDSMGYPQEKWTPEHKKSAREALKYVVQKANPVLLSIGIEESPDGKRYRVIKKIESVDTVQS